MTRLLIVVTFFFSTARSYAGEDEACKKLTPEGLEELRKAEDIHRVVFYASWCAACIPGLKSDYKKTVYVAMADTPERALPVLRHFQPNARCYLDHGVSANLGVVGLPYEHLFEDKGK